MIHAHEVFEELSKWLRDSDVRRGDAHNLIDRLELLVFKNKSRDEVTELGIFICRETADKCGS